MKTKCNKYIPTHSNNNHYHAAESSHMQQHNPQPPLTESG
eukprot:gene2959-1941_t